MKKPSQVSTGKWGMSFDSNGALLIELYSDPIYGTIQLQDHTAKELENMARMFLAEADTMDNGE